FHGIAARAFLVRPLHRLYFLLRRAVRVRTRRFRQGGSKGVCPREIIRSKRGRGNRENKEEPVKRTAMFYQRPGENVARVSMGKGARNSFAFSICKTGRARCAARKLVSGVGAIAACAAISHSANCSITCASFGLKSR